MRCCALKGHRVTNRSGIIESWLFMKRDWGGYSEYFQSALGHSQRRATIDPVPYPSCPMGLPLREAACPLLLCPQPHPYTNSSFSRTDRVSIRSYRTDISMSDFENSRDFGANDNIGASPVTQETSLGRKDGTSLT